MCMETYVQTYYNASFHPNPNAREASEKACQPHHDKKFLMGELVSFGSPFPAAMQVQF